MNQKCGYNFDNKLFSKLVKQTNATYEDLSKKLGICEASLVQYQSGKITPTVTAMIKISDYFQVPIDVFMGRYSQEDCAEILKGNVEFMIKCRKKAFEDYLIRKKPRGTVMEEALEHKDIYYVPYPYNLVECIFGEPVDEVINEDQLAGLEQALEFLTPRERRIVQLYFEEEKTLKEIGKEIGVTNCRIQQIIAKAIRKLRSPTKTKLIKNGPKAQELQRLEKLDEDIMAKKQIINDHLVELKELEERANVKEEEMKQRSINKLFIDEIGELDLSVRSYNCLRRANCQTIDEVLNLFESGRIWQVRNLGRKSIEEIMSKIGDMYDIEFELISDEPGPAYYRCSHNFKFGEVS